MKNKFLFLLVFLVALFSIPTIALADEGFYADDSVTLSKDINTTSFIAGNNVDVTSKIDGAAFVAGNNVHLKSSQDVLFTAGSNINLEGVTAKDVFLAGSTVDIKASTIRGLYAFGETVRIDSDISGNAYIGGNKVVISSKIAGNSTIDAEDITILDGASIGGVLKYPENAKLNIASTASVSQKQSYEVAEEDEEVSVMSTIGSKILSFISLLVIGLLLLLANNKFSNTLEQADKTPKSICKYTLFGFVCLITLPIAAVILLITVIGIPLSIISLILYGILIYLSVIPASYYLGKAILKDKISNKYLLLTVSLLGIFILKLIPVIGGLVTFLTICLGIWLCVLVFKNMNE